MKYIWTLDEIYSLPEFGEIGWFYGLVKDNKKIYFAEIFGGLGYSTWCWPTSLQTLKWAFKDIYYTPRRKARIEKKV